MGLIDEIRKTSKESKEKYNELIQSFIDKIENYKKKHPYSDGVCLGNKCGNDEAKILREKGYCIGFQGDKAWCYWQKKLTPKEEEQKRKYEEKQRIYWEKKKIKEGKEQFKNIISRIKEVIKDPKHNNTLEYSGIISEYAKEKLIEEGFKVSLKTYKDGNDYSGWERVYENIISW